MTKRNELIHFIESAGGVATSKQLLDAGFSSGLIEATVKRGDIDRETRGVYVLPDTILDDFVSPSLRWKRCIFSYGSAVYLHSLSNRMPARLNVTVPRSYNTSGLKAENPTLRVHRSEGEAFKMGLETLPSPSGIEIPVYDIAAIHLRYAQAT